MSITRNANTKVNLNLILRIFSRCAKGYNSIFKLAKAQCEYGFLFITFLYLEIVKSSNNIKLGIDFGLTKPLKSLIYKRYGVLVLNCNSVKSFIVNAELNTSFWLFSKKDRGGY